MKQRNSFTAACLSALVCICPGCQQSEEKAELKRLEVTWVQAHALAKDKPKGRGGYYVWTFKGEKVVRAHTQTLDGEPVIGSGHGGTCKIDPATNPKSIDITLKSPGGEDWKYLGIYDLEDETLKLCLSKDNRPDAFERKDSNSLYTLKRPPKE